MKSILVILILLMSVFVIAKKVQDDAPLAVRDSDYAWENDIDFVECLCISKNIDAKKDFYIISCPECIGGAMIKKLPDGSSVSCFYVHENGKSYCGKCGYSAGSDWLIYKMFYTEEWAEN